MSKLFNTGQVLGRSEMKKIMAGSGNGNCSGCSDCFGWGGSCNTTSTKHYCGMIQGSSGQYVSCYRDNF
jgi:hypothetical protein